MLYAGIIITVGKETLDVVAQKGWSWGDFFFGIAGAVIGIFFCLLLVLDGLNDFTHLTVQE